ncbi:MAG: recombinase family protein [Rhodobacteraceae bacterium]|nr:recombinase family protein [Paracoccaceae bacterium]MCY4139757.1 recombinase family protein [Paracoccaceae bacterium]
MMATMLAWIAQFERDLVSERVKSGLAAAKARLTKPGCQPGRGQDRTGSHRMSFRPSARDEVTAGSPVTSGSARIPTLTR